MKGRIRAASFIVTLAFFSVAIAAENPVNFSGKWVLENAQESFHPNEPMRTVGPNALPMDGSSVDVRTGGDGSYRGGESPPLQSLKNFSAPDLVIAVAQTESEIKFERRWTQDGQPLISHEAFTLDGKENIVRDSAGKVESKTKSKWSKGVLTITSAYQVPVSGRIIETRVKREFSLSEDGQILIIKTTQEIPRGQIVIKQTLKKS